jgi:hypothetical protein
MLGDWILFPYPEIGSSSTDRGQMSKFLPEDGDRIQSLKRFVLNIKRMMDNVQKTQ